jgi:hypothetical protein
LHEETCRPGRETGGHPAHIPAPEPPTGGVPAPAVRQRAPWPFGIRCGLWRKHSIRRERRGGILFPNSIHVEALRGWPGPAADRERRLVGLDRIGAVGEEIRHVPQVSQGLVQDVPDPLVIIHDQYLAAGPRSAACGYLRQGFARVRCPDSGHEYLRPKTDDPGLRRDLERAMGGDGAAP